MSDVEMRREDTAVADADAFLDFVLVGAPRCGTTWLANTLSQHPEVFVPDVKEVNFFGRPLFSQIRFNYEYGLDFYRRFFASAPRGAVCGELTPTYYIDPDVAGRIHRHFPDAKVIFLLRNPATMMHSMYLLKLSDTPMAEDFERSLERWPEFYELGRYHTYLQPFLEHFPRERIFVGIAEEIFADPAAACEAVYRFLGVDPAFRPTAPEKKVNERGTPKSRALVTAMHRARQIYNSLPLGPVRRRLSEWEWLHDLRLRIIEANYERGRAEDELDPETRARIIARCMPEIEAMEAFLGRELPAWKD